jgi:hypothetical protein
MRRTIERERRFAVHGRVTDGLFPDLEGLDDCFIWGANQANFTW